MGLVHAIFKYDHLTTNLRPNRNGQKKYIYEVFHGKSNGENWPPPMKLKLSYHLVLDGRWIHDL